MAMGCPVLVSKGTGLADVVGEAFSEYTVDVLSGAAPLAEKLMEILKDPSHYRKNSHRFKERALELIAAGEQKTVELLDMPVRPSDRYEPQFLTQPFVNSLGCLISEIWEDMEKADQRLSMNRFQVYVFQNGETAEELSIIRYYPMSEWCELKVEIPAGVDQGLLRIDPSDRPGTIYIKDLDVQANRTGKTIFRADGANRFAGFIMPENVDYEYDTRWFTLHAETDDPQILLRIPVVEGPMEVRANLYFHGS